MKNKYEFNIEDINSVVIIDKKPGSDYCTVYARKYDESNNKTMEFIETHHSNAEINKNTGEIKVLCSRCGTWNNYYINNTEDYDINNIEFECKFCTEGYQIIYTEDEMIGLIMSFMDKDMFNTIKIIINNTEII